MLIAGPTAVQSLRFDGGTTGMEMRRHRGIGGQALTFSPTVGTCATKEVDVRQWLSAKVSASSRQRKLAWLTNRIEPGSTVLLVGVAADPGVMGTSNVVELGLMAHTDATALVHDEGEPQLPCPWVRGSALDLPFDDQYFDYVVSNAVIEHVGGAEGAATMVSESRRVARKAVFHATPWRWSPVEVHTQLPLLHWLPRRVWGPVFRTVSHWTVMDSTWLLSRREIRHMGGTVHQPNVLTLVGEWTPTAMSARPGTRTDEESASISA
jgi:hypothetical protein